MMSVLSVFYEYNTQIAHNTMCAPLPMQKCTHIKTHRIYVVEYYRVEMFKILYSQLRNGEIIMVKYVYIVITIMNDVLWKGREEVFALSSMLI